MRRRTALPSLLGALAAVCIVLPVVAERPAMQTQFTVQSRDTGASGVILAAANGMTLYTFDQDPHHGSACTDECALVWPPLLLGDTDPVGSPDLPGVLSASVGADGRRQVAYENRLLYFYSGDAQPGDVRGDAIDGLWHVARPSPAAGYQQDRAAPAAIVRAYDQAGWQPPSVGIGPGGTVTWENHDPISEHAVECVQAESSAACPLIGVLLLPLPEQDDAGRLLPSTVSLTFPQPGTYAFRCPLFPTMTASVIVGAP